MICRLRAFARNPAREPKARSLDAQCGLDEVRGHLQDHSEVVARLAVKPTERCAQLTTTIKALEKEITELTTQLAPALSSVRPPVIKTSRNRSSDADRQAALGGNSDAIAEADAEGESTTPTPLTSTLAIRATSTLNQDCVHQESRH